MLWAGLAVLGACVVPVQAKAGMSLIWGVSASLLPSACFVWVGIRRYGGARQSAAVLSALYRAEALKFLITAAIFAAVFKQADKVYLPVFFLAFVTGQIASWLVMAYTLRRH